MMEFISCFKYNQSSYEKIHAPVFKKQNCFLVWPAVALFEWLQLFVVDRFDYRSSKKLGKQITQSRCVSHPQAQIL